MPYFLALVFPLLPVLAGISHREFMSSLAGSPNQPTQLMLTVRPRQAALEIFNDVLELQYLPDTITYTAAISTCTDCIQWRQALVLLQTAKMSSLQLDVIPYNATISACEKASRWNQSMLLLTSIEENELQADSVSFTASWQSLSYVVMAA